MSGIIDFHTHILPQMDDGSACVEESAAMLRRQAEQGIHHVIATPHFYPQFDSPEHFLDKRTRSAQRLREQLSEEEGLPKLSLGAEVYYYPGISDSSVLSALTIAQKKCILIEMPMPPWTEQMFRELEGIWTKQGLTPIIAHLDRYITPFRTYRIPQRLSKLPVLVQVNAEFFLRKSTVGMALRMLKNGQIHLLGSDCHNLDRRPPVLGQAITVIEKRLGQDAVSHIQHHQSMVLSKT